MSPTVFHQQILFTAAANHSLPPAGFVDAAIEELCEAGWIGMAPNRTLVLHHKGRAYLQAKFPKQMEGTTKHEQG